MRLRQRQLLRRRRATVAVPLGTPTLAIPLPNTAPLAFDVTLDATHAAGNVYNLQEAADSTFGTVRQNLIKMVAESEFAFGNEAQWTTSAMPPPYDASTGQISAFNTPSGDYALRIRVGYDDGTTITWGNWSNVGSGTISAASTTLTTSTGTGKSSYVTCPVSANNRRAQGTAALGSFAGVRATNGATGDRYFEVDINTLGSGIFAIGLDDGSTNFNGGFVCPGLDNSAGVVLRITPTVAYEISYGGVTGAGGASYSGGDWTAGDKIGVKFSTTAGTVTFYKIRSGTATQLGSTVTGRSFTTWKGFLGLYDSYDATANFGQSSFARALDSGYAAYG